MKNTKQQVRIPSQGLDEHIQLLAMIEPTNSQIVSCYLDMRDGVSPVKNYLDWKHKEMIEGITGHEPEEFDRAMDRIHAEINDASGSCKSMAIFFRSFEGGNFFHAIELDMIVKNSVSLSSVPDIYPLVVLTQERDHYLHVSLSTQTIQIHEVKDDRYTLLSMAALRTDTSEASRVATASHTIAQVLRNHALLHAIIYGDPSQLEPIYEALPRMLRKRVIQLVYRTPSDNDRKIREVSRSIHRRYQQHQVRERFHHIMYAEPQEQRLATGALDSLHAIKSGIVDRLFVSREYPEPIARAKPSNDRNTTRATALRLAIQMEIPVDLINGSQALDEADGMICALNSAPAHPHYEHSRLQGYELAA